MRSFILQDWNTIRGAVTTITQQETDWVDLGPFQDVTFWTDVREVTGTVTLLLQTAPSLDDSLFTAMITGTTLAAAGAAIVQAVFMVSAAVPVARYVRWQLAGVPTWDATLRILGAANAPGLSPNDLPQILLASGLPLPASGRLP